MVVSISDWVLLRSSVIASSLGSSVLIFHCAVCYQLHKQLEGFAMIFCFKHFSSKRYFDSFLGKFHAITGNFGKFLKREKRLHLRFLTEFWIQLCRVIYIQKCSYTFLKIAFLKDFSKFLETFPGRSTFQRSYRTKAILLRRCYRVKQLFWCFLNTYIKDYLEIFNIPVPLQGNYSFTPT